MGKNSKDKDGEEFGLPEDVDSTVVAKESGSRDGREHWDRHIEFFLTMLGYAVGLGNIWRFPYICMRNGGGVFLIPYFIALALVGFPIYYLELILSQFSGLRVTKLWSFCPLFKGVGWAMVILGFVISVQYSHCITWIVYYLGMSFYADLPWASCNNTWNTPSCISRVATEQLNTTGNYSVISGPNDQELNLSRGVGKAMTPGEEFWQYNVLELTSGAEEIGGLRWQLVVCHTAVWAIVFVCLISGIKSTGKAVYVTSIAPYILLTVLIIRGALLPGATEGIIWYISPVWSKLLDFKVWSEAFLQIFYSLGLSNGGILTFSSYNKFHNNCRRDAFIITLINCLTSVYGGFAIFSIIGHLAHESGVGVEEVLTSGPGLAFIAYPEALSLLPLPQFWSAVFFLMLATLGLGSQFGHLMTVVAGLTEAFPKIAKGRQRIILGCHCAIGFLLGLVFCTKGGMYYFQIIDWYSAVFTQCICALLEALVVSWAYGFYQIFSDVELMIGRKPWVIFKGLWGVVSPTLIVVFFLYSLSGLNAPTYGAYHYPSWALAIAWLLAVVSMIQIPLFAVRQLLQSEGTIKERLKLALRPSEEWVPQDERAMYKYKGGQENGYQMEPITNPQI